jgi:hypothetical protein
MTSGQKYVTVVTQSIPLNVTIRLTDGAGTSRIGSELYGKP